MSADNPFQGFTGQKYLNLETFRTSGEGVRTPVWFAAGPPDGGTAQALYVYSTGDSGKVKRIRNNPRVRVAPCDMRGNLRGEWVDARAEVLQRDEAANAMRLLNRKYFPLKQLLGFFAMFRPRDRAVFAIRAE